MRDITTFVKKFTAGEVEEVRDSERIGRQHFYMPEAVRKAKGASPLTPVAAGAFLGETKDGKFKPSLELLEILSRHSDRKAFAAKRGVSVFLYGNDLYQDNILRLPQHKGLCLVQTEDDRNLGYGEVVEGRHGMVIKNLLDRGDFLRREMKDKK